jgi:hypothetical protein
VGIVVEIFKHDGLAVIGLDAGLSQGMCVKPSGATPFSRRTYRV